MLIFKAMHDDAAIRHYQRIHAKRFPFFIASSNPISTDRLTSFIVFVVGARDLHGNAAARAPPAGVALAVPAVLHQDALPVPAAQAWASI